MKTSQFETTTGLARLSFKAGLVIDLATKLLAVGATLSVLSTSTAFAQATPIAPVSPNPNGEISAERLRAQLLFEGLTSIRVPIDDDRLVQMEALIKAGNEKGAAAIATQDSFFLDILIRDVARKMSTREETVRAPMSDFVASFIGIVRDSDTTSAKELLTANYYYRVDPAVIAALPAGQTVRQDEQADIVTSNNHYADMTARGLSAKAVLVRQAPQKVIQQIAGTATMVVNPEPAGLLSSRAFIQAHADAGTNRRLEEFTFRQFMCMEMADWSDANAADDRVSQDVTRTPSGSVNLYQTTCKACHAGMDALRGAWAFTDFQNNAYRLSTTVVGKMTRNNTEYPAGFRITDNSWENKSTLGKNADNLGWRGALSGVGMSSQAKMFADSRGFSRCLVRRAFQAVCRRNPQPQEEQMVRSLADQFESDGYHMRRMYENVAVQPQCLQ